jgi:phosphoadenosine phosphosulfate reductase
MTASASLRSSSDNKRINSGVLEDIRTGRLEALGVEEILIWAIKNFHPRLALSSSFGNAEGLVLLDMMHRLEPSSRVYVLDTGRLHQATYDLIDRVRDRYGKDVEVVFPESAAVEQMVREHGMNLFYESLEKRQLCCRLRKVEPNRRYLAELDGHVTGLRREQGVTRREVRKVEMEEPLGLVKINPLADWSYDQVWSYVRDHQVPVNRLHAEGFPSVGCAPCTRTVAPGDDPRSGRWWWENADTRECGLHVGEETDGSGI